MNPFPFQSFVGIFATDGDEVRAAEKASNKS